VRIIIILIIFVLIIILGCASAKQNYQKFSHSEYEVIDRGSLDVKVFSQACSESLEDALSAAKRNGEFHLRSVVGNKKHGIKFKEIGSYIKYGKICVEISASSLPP
tara:strand:+ start:110 stop:427 length:318 start_codon:yes stop_codon:yes gene_type:complete